MTPGWRLPAGWRALPDREGVAVAAGPERLLVDRAVQAPLLLAGDLAGPPDLDSGLLACADRLLGAREAQLLDVGDATAGDGAPARTALLASRDDAGAPLTTSLLLRPDAGDGLLVLLAVVPTPLWPALGPRLQRVLAGARPGRPAPPSARGEVRRLRPPAAEGEVTWTVDGTVQRWHRAGAHVSSQEATGEPLPAALLPHWLAASAGLGPRPVVPVAGHLEADAELVRALAHGEGSGVPDDLGGGWAEALRALAAARPRRLELRGPRARLAVLDGGTAGAWAAARTGERAVLRPLSAEQAWTALVRACAA